MLSPTISGSVFMRRILHPKNKRPVASRPRPQHQREDSAPYRQLCHFVGAQLHNAADSKAPKHVRVVSRLRRYSEHVRHVAAHSPVCIPPLKSLPSATRSPLFSLSAVCLHACVAPLTCARCSGGTWTICTFTRVSIDSPRQPFSESARWRASAEASASVRPAIGFSAATQDAGTFRRLMKWFRAGLCSAALTGVPSTRRFCVCWGGF